MGQLAMCNLYIAISMSIQHQQATFKELFLSLHEYAYTLWTVSRHYHGSEIMLMKANGYSDQDVNRLRYAQTFQGTVLRVSKTGKQA